MAEPLIIPKLGNTVEDVTLIEWLVPDGAQVSKGQEVLEIETDKSTFAVEATTDGFLHHGPFSSGDVVPVLTTVAVIGVKTETFPSAQPATATPAAAPPPAAAVAEPSSAIPVSPATTETNHLRISPRARRLASDQGVDLASVTPSGPNGRIIEQDVLAALRQQPAITPVARKMATEADLDIAQLKGTGPRGRITKKDVQQALTPPPTVETPAPVVAAAPLPSTEVRERIPLKGVRGIIAERMGTSVHTTARVTLVMEADASEFVAMRQRLKAQVTEAWGFAPGYNDLLGMIVARTLRQFPFMNARLTTDAIEYLAHINLGMAVDTERGLLVPNIKDADRKNLREFGAEFRELAEQARAGRISPDHLTGGTFTITSLGAYDVDAFTPVINLPEAAILGVGRIAAKAVVRNGEIVPRQMITLSLVFDHRLVDGAPAARFLQAIKRTIEEPYLLLAMI